MDDVLLAGLAGHEDVINVDEDEAQSIEDLVHEPLEGHPCILESKGHVQELEEAKGCDDGILGDRRLLQGWHRVLVCLGDEVEAVEVSSWLPATIFLLHQVERTALLGVGPPDDSIPFPGCKDLLGGA